jgi:hypothetical protein
MLAQRGEPSAVDLADLFCREARLRIESHFRTLFGPNDGPIYRVSQRVLAGEFRWLEQGIVNLVRQADSESGDASEPEYRQAAAIG